MLESPGTVHIQEREQGNDKIYISEEKGWKEWGGCSYTMAIEGNRIQVQ